MPCYSPLRAWRGTRQASGKRSVVFNERDAAIPGKLELPCGQCIGCRLERSRQWAMRCLHESELYLENCFITLTYDEAHLPKDGSLDVRDFQLFMKRLRKAYPNRRIRFFHCGEYGEKFGRPHYHACLFNFDFKDKVLYNIRNGNKLYVSSELNDLWGHGNCMIGDVTFESAAYVARYIMKKVLGDNSDAHYGGRKPEYTTMSRNKGIGYAWFEKFQTDVFPRDEVIVRGVKVKPPRYYFGVYETLNKASAETIKELRRVMGRKLACDNDSFRLSVKEANKLSCIKKLTRTFELEDVK